MCLIWGTTWLGIKIGLQTLAPFTGVGLRFAIAGFVLFIVAAVRGALLPAREYPWRFIALFSVSMFGISYVLNYIAETRLDSGLVSVLFGTLPFFTFGFGALMIGERAAPIVWLGAVLAFLGVAVISLTPQVRGSIPFALCTIVAAASSAFANVCAKKYAHHDPLVTLPPSMLISGLVIGTIGLLVERTDWHAVLGPTSLAALLYLALLGSSLAFFLMLWLLKHVPVYVVGLATLIFPIVALIAGAFYGEHAGARELLGSALVIGGLALALARRQATATS